MFHWTKVALLSIIAGTYCGFGFTLCLIVGGNAPQAWLEDAPGLFSLVFGAVGFPFSFTLVSVSHCVLPCSCFKQGLLCFLSCAPALLRAQCNHPAVPVFLQHGMLHTVVL